MSRSASLSLSRVEILEVEEKNNLQEVAVQFQIISEHGVSPVAQPDLSPCHVTEGNGPSFFPGCVVLPSLIAHTGFFFSFSRWMSMLIWFTVAGTSKLVSGGVKTYKSGFGLQIAPTGGSTVLSWLKWIVKLRLAWRKKDRCFWFWKTIFLS